MPSPSRVRVAHVITRMIVGGAQETALLSAALVDRERFDPIIITGPQTGSEGSLHERAMCSGVELIVVSELVRQVSPWSDLRAVPAVAGVLRRLRPTVVQTHSSKAGIIGRVAARRAGVPVVLHTVHGWPFHDHQQPLVRHAWRAVERRAAPLADRLLVVAEADRNKGLSAGVGRAEQYVTVRSGIELEHFGGFAQAAVRAELGIPADAAVMGAVNRLSPQKDPLTLVGAFVEVARRRPGAVLLLVGDGPLRADVERACERHGVRDRVIMTGLRHDVPRLLAAMDVFVSTSRWEGLPRTVLSAMASGLPVVATPADGVCDVVTDGVTGLLAAIDQPVAVAAAVLRVLDAPSLRAQMTASASAQLQEYSAGTMVRRLEMLYEELL